MTSRRVIAGLTGALVGVTFGLPMDAGRFARLLLAVVLIAGVLALVSALAKVEHRAALAMVASLAYTVHLAVATVLTTASMAIGRYGFITGDDAAYARLAWSFVEFVRERPIEGSVPPYWGGDAYLFGTWVYLEAAIFAVFGFDLLAPLFVNAALSTALAVLAYDMSSRLFGVRTALTAAGITAFFPSLMLWSSLHLKDTLAITLSFIVLWALLRFQLDPRLRWAFLAVMVLIPMESLRRYAFVGLALILPLGVAAATRLSLQSRVRWTAAAVAFSAVALIASQAGLSLGPGLLRNLEFTRQQMSLGARTGFVENPITVQAGDTFVVAGGSTADSRVVHVDPGTRVMLDDAGREGPGVVRVYPGDVVVVGPAEVTPAPTESRRVLAGPVRLASPASDEGALVARTAAHLPIGLAYALFAPFPWSVSRTLDLAVIPEMLLWYALLTAALCTLWVERRRLLQVMPMVLFAGGLLVLFALAQGNMGTLFRHRGMMVPLTIVLAAPQLVAIGAAVRSVVSMRRAARR